MLYILDEPSIGLHPRDTEKLIHLLYKLKERGNSVYVVEHDPDIIRSAEWIIDLGPDAGSKGGELIYTGTPEELVKANSITAKYLFPATLPKYNRRKCSDYLEVNNANIHNLKNVSVKIPKGVLTCVTGVAGSGKSSLIHYCFMEQYPDTVLIDQQPIGRSSRANPATFTGIFDIIRKEFAAATGTKPSLFSFNSEGACPKCNGQGLVSLELSFLDAMKTQCDECEGKRYKQEVLELLFQGKNIAEVLDMTVNRAMDFFKTSRIKKQLKILQEVGLGYLKLGQTLSSLSGGESQRLKIAAELHKDGNIYVMDEPTTGLHMSDIVRLYTIIQSLVAKNNTVIIIEHNLDIIKYADWIIDMGHEGGKNGGEVIFEGLPEDIVKCERSVTGRYLRSKF